MRRAPMAPMVSRVNTSRTRIRAGAPSIGVRRAMARGADAMAEVMVAVGAARRAAPVTIRTRRRRRLHSPRPKANAAADIIVRRVAIPVHPVAVTTGPRAAASAAAMVAKEAAVAREVATASVAASLAARARVAAGAGAVREAHRPVASHASPEEKKMPARPD